MALSIGFIRSLSYYHLSPYWEAFFTEAGFDCSFGSLDNETYQTPYEDEFCLPIKHFLAQAESLIHSRCDFLFSPLVYKLKRDIHSCPKIIMATELLKLYFPQLKQKGSPQLIAPILINPNDNLGNNHCFKMAASIVGEKLGLSQAHIDQACHAAESIHSDHKKKIKKSHLFHDEINQQPTKSLEEISGNLPRVLIAGHRYSVHNFYLNHHIVEELRKLNVQPLSKEHILLGHPIEISNLKPLLDTDIYFSEGREIFGSIQIARNDPGIKGIIYLSMINCGFDAVIEDVVRKRLLSYSVKPYLQITLDEQESLTNLRTRLEVFYDILRSSSG